MVHNLSNMWKTCYEKLPFVTKIIYITKNANFRRFIKIIALSVFIYQISLLTMEYLLYKTKVEVDIEIRKDSESLAVSVCYYKKLIIILIFIRQ